MKRDFKPRKPFEVLLTNITFFTFGKHNTTGFLSVMKDSHTGEIVSRAASASLKIDFVMKTLDHFTKHPLFFEHSDQGSLYVSDEFRNFLMMYKITQSMSHREYCGDITPMKYFFKTLKDHIDFSESETIEKVLIKNE